MNTRTQPIRFFHRGRVVEVADASPTRTRARLAARGRALHRHQGRLRRRRLRRLHRRDRRAGAATATRTRSAACAATVNACIQFLPTLDGKALFTVEDVRRGRRRAAPGAAGDGRVPRLAMRLLHAGLRDVAVVDLRAPQRARHAADARSSWPTSCRATCAAAPATGRSSMPASACSSCRAVRARHAAGARTRCAALAARRGTVPLRRRRSGGFHAPRTLDALAALRAAQPRGAAAGRLHRHRPVGQQAVRELRDLIYVGEVDELKRIEHAADGTLVDRRRGARSKTRGARWPSAMPAPARDVAALRLAADPQRRHDGRQRRQRLADRRQRAGADRARAQHRAAQGRRACARMPLHDFYVDYMKNRLEPGEFVQAIEVPLRRRAARRCAPTRSASATTATSRRVCAGFAIALDGDRVRDVRLAFGGMAAIVKRAARPRRRSSASRGTRPRCRPRRPRWRATSRR